MGRNSESPDPEGSPAGKAARPSERDEERPQRGSRSGPERGELRRREEEPRREERGRGDRDRDGRDRGRRDRSSEGHRERPRERDRDEHRHRHSDREGTRQSDRQGAHRSRDLDWGERQGRRGRDDRDAGRSRQAAEELPVIRGRGANRSGIEGQANGNRDAGKGGKEDAAPSAKAGDQEGTEAPVSAAKRMGPAGGAYIPPFRLAQMMKEAESKTDASYQRLTWDALRKSINGLVNKANANNIRPIIKELLSENLQRGRGLFCQSIMKSQVASPTYTPVFAALVAVITTRLPDVGTLLVNRLVAQFKRAFKRNDRALTSSVVTFLCHLANQGVVRPLLIAEVLFVLLNAKTDDSVELAVTALKESGELLDAFDASVLRSIMGEMRQVLQEGIVEQRVQYLVEGLFKVQRDGFEKSGFPRIPAGLDLLEDPEDCVVNFELEDVPEIEQLLNVFKFDPEYEAHEKEYEEEKKSWFGEDSDSDDESGSEGSSDEDEEDVNLPPPPGQGGIAIQDQTDTNLINLRRTIYLTIMSSMDFEEAGHKLMKIELGPGQEMEIVTMLIECCSQEKTYLRYYGLLAQRYCGHNQMWQALYEECFRKQYAFVHRLETNKLRNVAKFFAHLLATDSISWAVLDAIRITEDDTTSSSRIFIKILFQDLAENMGLQSLNERLQDPDCSMWFTGVFPRDTPRNMRFSINFFTSIGLGGLTDEMRAHLKELPKLIAAQQKAEAGSSSDSDSSDSDSSSESDSDSSDSGSSSSSSDDSSDSSDDDSSSGTEISEPPSKRGSKRHAPPPKSPKAGARQPPKSSRHSREDPERSSKRARVEPRREDERRARTRH